MHTSPRAPVFLVEHSNRQTEVARRHRGNNRDRKKVERNKGEKRLTRKVSGEE